MTLITFELNLNLATLYLFERKMAGMIPTISIHLFLLDACDGGVAHEKYGVIKEG